MTDVASMDGVTLLAVLYEHIPEAQHRYLQELERRFWGLVLSDLKARTGIDVWEIANP